MFELKAMSKPGLGPIVGHTTHNSSRLWIKAHCPEPDCGPVKMVKDFFFPKTTRYLGLVTITAIKGKAVESDPHLFRLRREFDTTGFFDLGNAICIFGNPSKPLEPRTRYQVKMCVLEIVDEGEGRRHMASVDLKRVELPENWREVLASMDPESTTAEFTTPSDKGEDSLRFFVGSCRYPGILWKEKESDRIFHSMFNHMRDTAGEDGDPALMLMIGDQIYADMLHRAVPLGMADTYQEFQERYNQAFGSPNLRRMMQHLPGYMILDDHEIEDNWHQTRLHKNADKRRIFNLAVGAYKSHQWIHSPRNYGDKLFYSFESNGFPFFVMDLRTHNHRHSEGDMYQNHLLGRPSNSPEYPSQLDVLIEWLREQQKTLGNRPKFLVSTLQFLPNKVETLEGPHAKAKEDSWPAFPTTRGAIIDAIVKNGIQNVVFLCGDVHCHSTTRIDFDGYPNAGDLTAYCITSSAFYWPFPFADGDPNCFIHNSRNHKTLDTFTTGSGITMDYQSEHFIQEDNFCDVMVGKDEIVVRAIGKKGRFLSLSDGKLAKSTLKLAAW